MTAASGWSLKRARSERIIRIAPLAALVALGLAACSLGGGGGTGQHTASSATVVLTPTPLPSAEAATVWVLTPVGLNLRAAPTATSDRLAILARGAQLDVLGSQSAGGQAWLHVRGHNGGGIDGWVLDDPALVIHRAVNLHFDSVNGWSMLFPADWQLTTGTPTAFGSGGQLLQVWWAADVKTLPTPPASPGKEVRDEGPVDVYGRTTFLTVYRLDAGGFEYDDTFKVSDNPARAFEFRFRDPGAAGDTSLFKQLLTGVVFG